MSGHTKGPWRAEGPDVFGDFNILHDADALAVAAVVDNMREPSVTKANARLIAAAPDMYEALKSAGHALKSYQYGNSSTELAESVAEMIDATVAKIEGRP